MPTWRCLVVGAVLVAVASMATASVTSAKGHAAASQQSVQCKVSTGQGTIDLGRIFATMLSIPLESRGNNFEMDWGINMCAKFALPNPPYGTCARSGYILEYTQNSKQCDKSFNQVVVQPTWNPRNSSVDIVYQSDDGSEMYVSLECGQNPLTAVGKVQAVYRPTTFNYRYFMRLSDHRICATGTPAPGASTLPPLPTATPSPASPLPPTPSQCSVTTGGGRVINLDRIRASTFLMPQLYNGQQTSFYWQFSLCAPVAPPSNFQPCREPGYIGQWDPTGYNCELSFSTLKSLEWNGRSQAVVARYTDRTGNAFEVSVSCGGGRLSPSANHQGVQVMGQPGSLTFLVWLTDVRVCSGSTPSPFGTPSPASTLPPLTPIPTGTPSPASTIQPLTPAPACSVYNGQGYIDLGELQGVIIGIDSVYQGQVSKHYFGVSLCTPLPPQPTYGSCPTAGYVQEWNYQSKNCDQSFNTLENGPYWDASSQAAVAVYTTAAGWKFKVSIVCGTSRNVRPVANSVVTITGLPTGGYEFRMQLESHLVCSQSPSPLAPSPPPPRPPTPFQCSVFTGTRQIDLTPIRPVLVQMEQLYRGLLSQQIFGVSLCTPLSQQPGYAQCPENGFVMEWSPNKQTCERTFPSTKGSPTWDKKTKSAVIVYQSAHGSIFTISVGCGQGSLAPKTATYVTVDQYSNDTYSYKMQLTDSRLC